MPAPGAVRGRTACAANCGGRSFLECDVVDGRLKRVRPAPLPDGRYAGLCVRCLMLPEWVYSRERIETPLLRDPDSPRGRATFSAITWDAALEYAADRLGRLRDAHGGASIGFARTSGASPLGDYRRLGSLLHATNLYGGVDMGVHMGINAVFGDRGTYGANTNEWTDRRNAATMITWGQNPAETAMTSFRHLLDAQEAGAFHIVVDPRYSATAAHADWWIAPRPGTDLALLLSLVNHVVTTGAVAEEFVAAHTTAPVLVRADGRLRRCHDTPGAEAFGDSLVAWDRVRGRVVPLEQVDEPALRLPPAARGLGCTVYELLTEHVREYTPAWASEVTGLAVGDIVDLARRFVDHGPVSLGFGYGVDRYGTADALTHAGAILALLTSNVGRPGATVGVNSHGRGYHSASLGRDVDLPPGARMVSLPNAAAGREASGVRALFNCGDWLNQRIADMNTLTRWVEAMDFVLTIDHVWNTTCAWSDLILPASTFLEGDEPYRDVVAAGNCIILRRPVISPVGQSKPDHEIERLLGERLGYGEHLTDTVEQRIDRQLSGSPDPYVATLSAAVLAREGGAVRLKDSEEPLVLYADHRFGTASGRAELYIEVLAELGEALPAWRGDLEIVQPRKGSRFPLTLVQNHVRQRAHSTFYNVPMSLEIWPRPVVEMNPDDAQQRGIADGDVVEVFNDRGSVTVHAVLNLDYPPSMCSVSEGWKQSQFVAGNLQQVTNPTRNPRQELRWGHTNIPHYDTRVQIRRTDVGEVR